MMKLTLRALALAAMFATAFAVSSSAPAPAPAPAADDSVADIVSASVFEDLLPFRNDDQCPAKGFYTYESFLAAAGGAAGFGTTGDDETRRREVAAWLAEESHDTDGGSGDGEDRYAWGFCFKPAIWNGATNATAVLEDGFVKVWMKRQQWPTRPSPHDVATGKWKPSDDDLAAGRVPGFGVITNIIDGTECGHGKPDGRSENRIGFYKRYCDILGVSYGDHLDCYDQKPFGTKLTTATTITGHADA